MWDPNKARYKLPTPSSEQRAILDTASVSVSIPKYSGWEKYASSQERDGQEAEIKGKGSWPIGLAQLAGLSAETFLQKLVQAKHFGLFCLTSTKKWEKAYKIAHPTLNMSWRERSCKFLDLSYGRRDFIKGTMIPDKVKTAEKLWT